MERAAVISPHALVAGQVGEGCTIQAFSVVASGAALGDRCLVEPHTHVGAARLGDDCVLRSGAVIGDDVELGDGVEVLNSAIIGRAPGGAGATALEPILIRHVRIGDGCAIGAHATIYYGVEIGSHTLVGDAASIREGSRIGSRCIVSRCVTLNYDVRIGDAVKIMDNTHITGGTRIADGAFISTMVATANDNHPREAVGGKQVGPEIGAGATVGAGAILLPGVVIGPGANVAAGAVVTRNVPAGATVMGVPARVQTD